MTVSKKHFLIKAVIFAVSFSVIAYINTSGGYAQGNTVSGQVFGVQRQPVVEANVELLNEFSQLVARTRTDTSGRYFFSNVPSGNLVVHILPREPEYEEASQQVPEIINFTRETPSGTRLTGFDNQQLDFYLKLRKGVNLVNEALFVQQVPDNAKKLYEKGIDELRNKKQDEGLSSIKAAIEAFPKYFDALEKLGTDYVRLGHYQAAQVLLTAAVEVNPRSYRSWYGLAYALNVQGFVDDAYEAAKKSVGLYDQSADSLLLYGNLLRSKKQYTESEKELLKAIDVSHDGIPLAHWYLALLYANDLKRFGDAAKQLSIFLKQQPDSKDAERIRKLISEFESRARS